MVHGSYSMKVFDPAKLVIGLTGLGQPTNEEFVGWFRELVMKTIRDDVAELMVKQKWPMLDVTSGAYTEEICKEVITGLREHVEGYGVEVTALGNFHLSMNDGDEQRLNKLYENAAYVNMAGGIDNYQKVAAASAMMGAGEGLKQGGGGGSDGMATGAGLGMGMAMANMMNQAMQGGGGQGHAATPAPGVGGGMPDVMTPAQAAQFVQVTEADIVAAIEAGDLKAKKIGATYRITRAALEAFLHA
jgi:excisionase family DNA binding protein